MTQPTGHAMTRGQAKRIRSLKARRRREAAAFLAEGVRVVEELLASRLEIEFVVAAPALSATSRGERLLQAVAERGLPLFDATDRDIERLADTESPQGVLAVAREPTWHLAEFEPGDRSAVLVFDRVMDPGNLGTLVRTARALGIDWALATPGSVDPWSPKAVRASAGSIFHLPVSREDWRSAANWLREREFAILCADPGGVPVGRGDPVGRFALVLGNEPSGLSDEVGSDCTRRVAIKLPGPMDSLNVAVAGALLLDRLLDATDSPA